MLYGPVSLTNHAVVPTIVSGYGKDLGPVSSLRIQVGAHTCDPLWLQRDNEPPSRLK